MAVLLPFSASQNTDVTLNYYLNKIILIIFAGTVFRDYVFFFSSVVCQWWLFAIRMMNPILLYTSVFVGWVKMILLSRFMCSMMNWCALTSTSCSFFCFTPTRVLDIMDHRFAARTLLPYFFILALISTSLRHCINALPLKSFFNTTITFLDRRWLLQTNEK